MFPEGADGVEDTSKLFSDLNTCLSGDPNTASQVGEILAQFASEGVSSAKCELVSCNLLLC